MKITQYSAEVADAGFLSTVWDEVPKSDRPTTGKNGLSVICRFSSREAGVLQPLRYSDFLPHVRKNTLTSSDPDNDRLTRKLVDSVLPETHQFSTIVSETDLSARLTKNLVSNGRRKRVLSLGHVQ